MTAVDTPVPVGTLEECEAIARSVACPRCGQPPGQRCIYPGRPPNSHERAHVGRLKAALPPPREPRWWWLDAHDDLLINAWLREHGEVLLAKKRTRDRGEET